jgi:N-acetylmuramoyl-L-alanine amidase
MVLIKKPAEEIVIKETVKKPIEAVVEKQQEVIEPKKTEIIKNNTSSIIFKVQLMATVKTIPLVPNQFKGLNKLSKEPIRNLYRYMYGNVITYKEALLLKTNADQKGYTTSYIVAYKDGVRIPTPEARKLVSE